MISNKIHKLLKILSYKNYIYALLFGVAAGVEHEGLLRMLSCNSIVDIGANRGQFALVSRKAFPSKDIFSFEPLEKPSEIFEKVFKNDLHTYLYRCAIGQERKIANIHISKDDDSSSLLMVSDRQKELFPNSVVSAKSPVQVIPLIDALAGVTIPAGSLMKIDVQGYELEVLQGSEELLGKFSHLYIECSYIELYQGQALAHQVIDWLSKRNFILKGVYNTYYDKYGQSIQSDLLFAHALQA